MTLKVNGIEEYTKEICRFAGLPACETLESMRDKETP